MPKPKAIWQSLAPLTAAPSSATSFKCQQALAHACHLGAHVCAAAVLAGPSRAARAWLRTSCGPAPASCSWAGVCVCRLHESHVHVPFFHVSSYRGGWNSSAAYALAWSIWRFCNKVHGKLGTENAGAVVAQVHSHVLWPLLQINAQKSILPGRSSIRFMVFLLVSVDPPGSP